MSSVKNRERILEAIDQLRRRKARPDVQRICNYLFRRYAINSVEARQDLDLCVANNYVLKVEYKNNISYRNAAKKHAHMRQKVLAPSPRRPPIIGNSSNPNDVRYKINRQFNELLTNAFGELIVEEPDYLEMGIPSTEIINNILAKDSVRYTKKYISILLEKEVEGGGLIKLETGNYLMGPSKVEDNNEKEKEKGWKRVNVNVIQRNDVNGGQSQSNNRNNSNQICLQVKKKKHSQFTSEMKTDSYENMDSSTNSADEKKSDALLRTGGRRKRAKKVFDPSDNNVPKKRGRPAGSLNKATIEKQIARMAYNDDSRENRPDSRTSSNGRDQHGVCSVCHIQNRKGPNDRLIACRECSNKAHFSCLNGEDMMLKMYPDNTWQCPHCKTCVVCFETSNSGSLTVCSVCADGYHAGCHQPRIIDKLSKGQKWSCSNCQMPDELKINQIQANVNSFSRKSASEYNTSSNSGNSSPLHYNSPSISPTPPHLSPQTTLRPESPDGDGDAQSDSQSNKDDDENSGIDPSIPDATHWTPDEVYEYFRQYFPEEAIIFKEQEIDGRSLLLLRRIDVLTNLNLRLGPALKIYRHVVKLQVRRDDPKLYWL